ncbi:MAG: hypothetical protein L6V88_04515 [Anaerotruncus sp.]|nr:MAG: hypothetical protein L6V88_04515 [Anaerotruncus sp.]
MLRQNPLKLRTGLFIFLIKYPDCAKHLGDFNIASLPQGYYQKVFNMVVEHIENGYD